MKTTDQHTSQQALSVKADWTAALATALAPAAEAPQHVLEKARAQIAAAAVFSAENPSQRPEKQHFPLLTALGWAAAACFAVLWLTGTAVPKSNHGGRDHAWWNPFSKKAGESSSSTEASPAEETPDQPPVSSSHTLPEAKKPNNLATRPTQNLPSQLSVLKQDNKRLKSELGVARASQAAVLMADPKVARPTIIQLSDPSKPTATGDKKGGPSLPDRVGKALERELNGNKDQDAPEPPKAPSEPPPPPPPPQVFIDRRVPPAGEFTLPIPSLEEIGGGYFYDRDRDLIMEPTGDGHTYRWHIPGPDFDRTKPRLAPVEDLAQSKPPTPDPKPEDDSPTPQVVPEKETEISPPVTVPETPTSGYVWVDQTTGQGALILPSSTVDTPAGTSYWLWMTVPGREAPVAVGQIADSAAGGGSFEFNLPQPGLIPGNFTVTRETTAAPAGPSSEVILRGP